MLIYDIAMPLLVTRNYEDEDFLYEGPKAQEICEAYSIGREGWMQGSKCLDHYEKWDEKLSENVGRCYTCGMKDKQRGSHRSTCSPRPGGGGEFEDIEARVNAWIRAELPRRPNGEQPRMAQQR